MTPTHKYNTFSKRLLAGIINTSVFLPFSIINRQIENNNNKNLLISWTIFYTICWTLYVIIGHEKYGQTIGKRLMNIKVFDIMNKTLLDIKEHFSGKQFGFLLTSFSLYILLLQHIKVLQAIKNGTINQIPVL